MSFYKALACLICRVWLDSQSIGGSETTMFKTILFYYFYESQERDMKSQTN